MSAAHYTIAVRSMCEFTAKEGDLDLRFTPSPSAQEGIAGHKLVSTRRHDGYESEVTLCGRFRHLQVRGRADGYDPVANRLEEIKTFRGDLGRQPANHRQLHWAQAKIYGWLLCETRALKQLTVALVYFDIASQEETVFCTMFSAAELEAFFALQCGRFLDWAQQEVAHRAQRNAALVTLPFAHPDFRAGQRTLAEAVYRAGAGSRCLMVQAPTGIGKTIGTIFPALKAMPARSHDKLFFLTAKTSGRQVALDTLRLIRQSAPVLPLRVIEIVAKEQACEHPGKACHGDACPLARGFYDRLPAARAAALAIYETAETTLPTLLPGPDAIRTTARAHQVCPYYLTQELVRWADVVVADYNYYFDLAAMLHGLTLANDWRVNVLVDEAHNLLERGRSMYSATLEQSAMRAAQTTAPALLRAPLAALARRWEQLLAEAHAAHAPENHASESYTVLAAIPAHFRNALQGVLAAMGEFLAENPAGDQPDLLRFYFDALHFARLAESFAAHSVFDLSRSPMADGSTLCIRNIVPGPFLKPRFVTARSATLFSATLSPQHFYRDTLGLPENAVWTEVPSPFVAQQLAVRIVDRISTRYTDRAKSLLPIVELMATQFAAQPGNYLAFFSSYSYLQQVSALFAERYPHIAIWQQSPRMDTAAQAMFLNRFVPAGTGIGFAVLGGAFAEGIDLPGQRLIGAFIATLGLPQLNPVNEQVRKSMQHAFAAGYDYTYLYPGIRKVVQAAGRVIRTEADRGVVYLIDDRFATRPVLALLPSWWEAIPEVIPNIRPAMP